MKPLKMLWNLLLKAESAIMMAASIGVVLLVFVSVLMRYILEKNTGGMEELIVIVATWIYFIGGAYGSYENSHITADFISVFIHKEKTKEIVAALRLLVSLIILIGASYCALELFMYTAQKSSATPVLKIPRMIVYLPVYIGILLMTFYTAVHFVNSVLVIMGKKEKEVVS